MAPAMNSRGVSTTERWQANQAGIRATIPAYGLIAMGAVSILPPIWLGGWGVDVMIGIWLLMAGYFHRYMRLPRIVTSDQLRRQAGTDITIKGR
jgi:hypothetical protein